jgi:hypothetical protein
VEYQTRAAAAAAAAVDWECLIYQSCVLVECAAASKGMSTTYQKGTRNAKNSTPFSFDKRKLVIDDMTITRLKTSQTI